MNYKLVVFDYSALADKNTGNLLPGSQEKVSQLGGVKMAIALADSRVGLRHWMLDSGEWRGDFRNVDPHRLPAEAEVVERIEFTIAKLNRFPDGGVHLNFVYRTKQTNAHSPAPIGRGNEPRWDPSRMIGGGRLIEDAVKQAFDLKGAGGVIEPFHLQTLVVSNDPKWLEAAGRAKVSFVWSDVYFSRAQNDPAEIAEYYNRRNQATSGVTHEVDSSGDLVSTTFPTTPGKSRTPSYGQLNRTFEQMRRRGTGQPSAID